MLTDEVQALRRTRVTATDVVRLAGLHPSGHGAAHVYAEKMGLLPEVDAATEERFALGHALEQVMLDRFEAKRGKPIECRSPFVLLGERYCASPDAYFAPDDDERYCPIECKAVGTHRVRDWRDGLPLYVAAQVQWQLYCMEAQRGLVLAVLGGTEWREPEWVYWDPEAVSHLVRVADAFLDNHLLPGIPPPPDGTPASEELTRKLYPRHVRPAVNASPDAGALAAEYRLLGEQIADLDKQRSLVKERLCREIGDAEGISGVNWKASWKWQAGSTYTTTRKDTRVFRLTFDKE